MPSQAGIRPLAVALRRFVVRAARLPHQNEASTPVISNKEAE
jgi:hypothetical protein